MKQVALIFFWFITCWAYSQNSRAIDSIMNSAKIYILDSTWNTYKYKQVVPMNDYPNYLWITDEWITLYGRSRIQSFAYDSRIVESDSIIGGHRIVGEMPYRNPVRPVFAVTGRNETQTLINFYSPLGRLDAFFVGHEATKEEITDLLIFLGK